jgi:hypothetical protein
MYTAKINRKEDRGGAVEIFVDFTDGVKTYTDSCIPQDAEGFKYWVKSRLSTYNTAPVLTAELIDGADVDVSDPEVVPPVLTQAEIDRNTWLGKYFQWVRIKQTVVDTGIVPLSNTKIAALLQNLKDTLKPEYIDYI